MQSLNKIHALVTDESTPLRLFLYFTSSRGEFYIFHLYLVAFIFIIS